MLKKPKGDTTNITTCRKCMTAYIPTVSMVTISNWKRWNAVCAETRTYGVKWGKRRRLFQTLTYHYSCL